METAIPLIADIEARLARLPEAQSDEAKIQLALVKALLVRCREKNTQVQEYILQKASTVLTCVESREITDPDSLKATEVSDQTKSSLAKLTEQLYRNAQQPDTASANASLDELMEHVERDITLQVIVAPSLNNQNVKVKKSRSRKKTPAPAPVGQELKAMRLARKSMAIDKASRMVDDMNSRQPENPGPLNPQMLATKAISQMRDISPAYLNRFLTMMDTLLWLPKN